MDEYFEVRNEFYKDTQGLLVVFDTTSMESFQSLDSCLAEARKFGLEAKIPMALCANKIDLGGRAVSEDEGRKYANKHGMTYFETSASSGANVSEVFEHLFGEVVRR